MLFIKLYLVMEIRKKYFFQKQLLIRYYNSGNRYGVYSIN